ncbi:MAG: glycosyltransferase family 2 protein [Opitutaceae bacterium]
MNPASATPLPAVCGVVVTFHPEPTLLTTLVLLVQECGRVIVVDNGSGPAVCGRLATVTGVEVIALPTNLGVAAALNRGAIRARELGATWMVTFDQDSRPRPGMVAALWATHLRFPPAAVVGPCIADALPGAKPYRWVCRHSRIPGFFQRKDATRGDLEEVTMMVTSGSMVDLTVWGQLAGFDEALFIDYVDTDYCLRVIAAGRTVAVSAAAVLEHRLGNRQPRQVLGQEFRPTHHAAFRHYYMARNRVTVWRRHAGSEPHWALFDAGFALYNAFRVVAFETGRRGKLRAMLLGTWDGLCGRGGPLPEPRRRSIEPVVGGGAK